MTTSSRPRPRPIRTRHGLDASLRWLAQLGGERFAGVVVLGVACTMVATAAIAMRLLVEP